MEDIFKAIVGVTALFIVVITFPLWVVPYLACKVMEWSGFGTF